MLLRHLKITYKLLVIFILVALIPTFLSAFFISKLVLGRIEEGMVTRTKEAMAVTKSIMFTYLDKATADAYFISENKELKDYLASQDLESLKNFNLKISRHFVTALIEIFDSDGNLLSRCDPLTKSANPNIYTTPNNSFIQQGLRLEKTSSIIGVKNNLLVRSVNPILDPTFKLLGIVIVSYSLDESFVDYVKTIANTDVSVFINNRLVDTSLRDRGVRLEKYNLTDKTEAVLRRGENLFITEYFLGKPYSVAYSALKDINNNILGMISVAISKSDIIEIQKSSMGTILLLALGAFLLAIFLSFMLSRGITSSLNLLLTGTRRISLGDLSTEIKLKTKDEIGELAKAFNQMTKELKKSRDDLQEYNLTLAQRVAERTKELENAQSQLVQSAKMASVGLLAGGVAHEINNPLTGVLNNVQLIKMFIEQKNNFSFNDFKDLLNIIEESAIRCKRITQSLLDFSHASKGIFQPVSLNEIIEKVCSLIEHELKLHNVTIERELSPILPLILGDSQLLQQVIFDIVNNGSWAIQSNSSKQNGVIKIRTRYNPEKKTISIFISDNGIGIAKENIPRIFEPFFTTKPVGEGTGIGLSIVYNIIKAHTGIIEVESQLNKGTAFTIYFPVFS